MPPQRRPYLEAQDSQGAGYGLPMEVDPYAEFSPEDADYLRGLEPQGEFQPEQFQRGGSELFAGLEGMDMPQPTSFGGGLVSGLVGGLGSAGTRAEKSRARFEASELERRKQFDSERREASRFHRSERGRIMRENIKTRLDAKKDREKYMEDTRPIAESDPPSLRRFADAEGRVPIDILEKRTAPEKDKGQEPLVAIETPSGPRLVPRSQAINKEPARPRTAGGAGAGPKISAVQIQSENFRTRAQQADATAMALEDSGIRASRFHGKVPIVGFDLDQLQGDKERQYWQTVKQFTEAHLRKESGGAITKEELEDAAKTYFAQPNDSKTLIDQKRAARQLIISGLGRFSQVGSAQSRTPGFQKTGGGAQSKQELGDVKASALRSIQAGDFDTFDAYIEANPELDNDPELEAALDAMGVPR